MRRLSFEDYADELLTPDAVRITIQMLIYNHEHEQDTEVQDVLEFLIQVLEATLETEEQIV